MTRRQLAVGAGIGLIAGVASGYVGVGGGFIMVPLMLSLVGIAMKQASGTSLIAVAILAIPGVVEQVLLGNVQYLAGIAVAIGSIPGAVVGARLLRVVPERQLRFLFGFFLIVAAAVLVLLAQSWALLRTCFGPAWPECLLEDRMPSGALERAEGDNAPGGAGVENHHREDD